MFGSAGGRYGTPGAPIVNPAGGAGGSGIGGGGNNTPSGAGNGSPNTGSGGGGMASNRSPSNAGAGGSGVVIIAYPTAYPGITSINPGLSYDTPSGRPGYRVYRFTGGSGPISW
jgi:hypothetical protein